MYYRPEMARKYCTVMAYQWRKRETVTVGLQLGIGGWPKMIIYSINGLG